MKQAWGVSEGMILGIALRQFSTNEFFFSKIFLFQFAYAQEIYGLIFILFIERL